MKPEEKQKLEEMREKIEQYHREGKVVFMTIEGAMVCDVADIVKQPVDGLLYDLNRDKATIFTWLGGDDEEFALKWINDYACSVVIEYLYNRVKELEGENDQE